VEGAGKSTQIELLRTALEEQGLRVLVTREPGGEPVAEAIRNVLLHTEEHVEPLTELLLFLAARAQITERVIRPALRAGTIVLCDRYLDSTTVYQGHARGLDLEMVRLLNRVATGGQLPDLTIVLDLDERVGIARQASRNRMEREDLAFHRAVRQGYLAEAAREPERFHVVNAEQSVQCVHAEVLAIVRKALGNR
jgi:dTMP kinase